MSATLYLYNQHKTNFPTAKYSFDINMQFNRYLKSKFTFVKDTELLLKTSFKDAEDEEEINAFFELDNNELISELNFFILSYDEFKAVDSVDKVMNMIKQMQTALYGNLKNSEIILKTLDNLQLLSNFFDTLMGKYQNILESFSITEKEFKVDAANSNLKTLFVSLIDTFQRMAKSIRKVKKTQITFTIEAEILSYLIQNMNKSAVNIDTLMKYFNESNSFFEQVQHDLDLVLQVDLNIQSDEIDSKIKNLARDFCRFFTDKKNSVNLFLSSCYIYRESIIDRFTCELTIVANFILNKLRGFKTYLFVNYYYETIEPALDRDLKHASVKSNRFFDSKTLNANFEKVNEKTANARIIILYVKDMLLGKKIDAKAFNNPYIDENIPKISDKMIKLHKRINKIQEELDLMEIILPAYDDYIYATVQLKSINLNTKSLEEKLKIQKLLRNFVIQNKKLENLLYDYRNSSTTVYQQITDIIEGNKIIAEQYRSLFFLMDK